MSKGFLGSGIVLGLVLLPVCLFATPVDEGSLPPALEGLDYSVPFFEGTTYDPSVASVEDCLGFGAGERAATPAQVEGCLKAFAESSDRVRLFGYAQSHEEHNLYYLAVSSPANLERLEDIRGDLARLEDPRDLSEAEAEALLERTPGTAWLAYSIHGDETSGTDAALVVLHHLAAAVDGGVPELLEDLVVLIDPMQNPDGRHRYLQMVTEHRGTSPSVDDQSLLHSNYWPWGRTNHYGFDLNRDWVLGVTPEGRGRIAAAQPWNPLLFVDAHEMGGQDTYLFSPARSPRNPHNPASRDRWSARFSQDQAAAFDRQGWVYYTGEWNEGWYPGYTDAWGHLRGAVGILYEQAGFTEDGLRRPGGAIHTYREAVHHQAVSSLANLRTLHENRDELRRDQLAERRRVLGADSPYAGRTFAVLPTDNQGRLERFAELMQLQGFEIYRVDESFEAGGSDQLGVDFRRRTLPAGTLLVPNRQPQAPLIATMLEPDAQLPPEYLRRERKSILRDGSSTIYDVTSWSVPLWYGLETWTLATDLPDGVSPWTAAATEPLPVGEAVAWVFDGADDRSVAVAARLMDLGVEIRFADRDFELGEGEYSRGSIVVLPIDNRTFEGELTATLDRVAKEKGLAAHGVTTGLGDGELADLGGSHFQRLQPPRVAVISRGSISAYDVGSIWFALDHRLGLRHSQLDLDSLNFTDLRRYNVVVLPDLWFGSYDAATLATLKTWVEQGGTLIATGGAAVQLSAEDSEFSAVRHLSDVQGDLDQYEQSVWREWLAAQGDLPSSGTVWSHAATDEVSYPWNPDLAPPGEEERKRQDTWNRMFMPRGTMLAARTDDEHWLTAGSESPLPVLHASSTALMSSHPVETPIRLGVYQERSGAEARRIGWSVAPAGQDLVLRLGGLLWPEASSRLANAAWLTRERKGQGQVILFATPPTFRGATPAAERPFLNAVIYGPGLGASTPILP